MAGVQTDYCRVAMLRAEAKAQEMSSWWALAQVKPTAICLL